MDILERATVLHYHRHRLAEHGAGTAQALGWRGADSQRRRFEVIASVTDFNGASVLDLGCGTGDLKAWLDARFTGLRYLGIDQMPEFIQAASARFAHQADTAFVQGPFDTLTLPKADVVVACGALGYRVADPHWVFKTIAHMYAAATRLLVFNVLDARHFPEHPLLVGRDVAELQDFCRKLSPEVHLLQGYAVDDATLVMHTRSRA